MQILYLNEFLRLSWLHELRWQLLFNAEDDALVCPDADGSRAEL